MHKLYRAELAIKMQAFPPNKTFDVFFLNANTDSLGKLTDDVLSKSERVLAMLQTLKSQQTLFKAQPGYAVAITQSATNRINVVLNELLALLENDVQRRMFFEYETKIALYKNLLNKETKTWKNILKKLTLN